MDNKQFKGIELPKVKFDIPDFSANIQQMNSNVQGNLERIAEHHERERRYKNDVLATLKVIEANTVGLNEIVPLLSANVEKQEEILEFLKETLAISTSQNQKEAESKWRQLMTKANDLTTDLETIQKLNGFVNTIYNMVIQSL